MTVGFYLIVAAAVLTFVAASVARAVRYARQPVHLRWELYPVPHETAARAAHGGSYFEDGEWWRAPRRFNRVGEWAFLITEMLFLRSLREFNRTLWFRSFPFHFGLYLLAMTGGLVLVTALATVVTGPVAVGALTRIVSWVCTATGTVGICLTIGGALALLHRRVTDHALRPYTTGGDFFNLLFFVVALGLTGLGYAARPAGSPGALSIAIGLFSWDTTLRLPPLFASGLVGVALLMAYVPLTHMSHFIGKYFTYHAVRWDDAPLAGNRRLTAALAASLTCRPTWAAKHILRGGAPTWAEIATSDPAREAK